MLGGQWNDSFPKDTISENLRSSLFCTCWHQKSTRGTFSIFVWTGTGYQSIDVSSASINYYVNYNMIKSLIGLSSVLLGT